MRSLAIILVLLLPLTAQAISPEELRLLVGDAEREKRVRASRVDPNDLSKLLPQDKDTLVGSPEAKTKPEIIRETDSNPAISNKYSTTTPLKASNPAATNSQQSDTAAVSNNKNVYVPPARYAVRKDQMRSDAVEVDQRRFGIRMGSWVKARVGRDTTSSDPGLVELELTAAVDGNVRPLAAGTLLFAEKAYNQGTRRLDMRVVKAITPDGEELEIAGLVYDVNEHAGLLGIVTENPAAQVIGGGMKHGLLEAGRLVAREMTGNDIVGTVAGSTADAVIDEKQTVLEQSRTHPFTIHVGAQDVLVRVEETF